MFKRIRVDELTNTRAEVRADSRDDGNGDDDTRNGDDDTGNGDDDDRNGDDDAVVDDDVNEDDYDNVDGNDSSVTDKETLSMFDGTYATDEERWENFSAQVSAQFKDNVNGLALMVIDLAFFPICLSGHFYVVVFSLTNTTSMTILDNSDSGATYDSKYKQACDLLVKKLFTRHLKLYGHQRHSKIQRLKAKILKMKWKTKTNFRDCGIFTMLHMESYSGQTASTWDCGWFLVK
ncbi:ulp1 protease family, C-terminal catalytic domain-containing protein [Tanacetum coccineum]